MNIISALTEIVGKDSIFTKEPMSKHTTFKVGGMADYLVLPSNAEEIKAIIQQSKVSGIPYYVMGNGSNVLVSDKGYRGIIIVIGSKMSQMSICNDVVTVQSGALLSQIGNYVAKESLTGFEFASGIPGTLGGACVMNAGAYGGEMKDVLVCLKAITPQGDIRKYSLEEMELAYRHTFFTDKEYVILEAKMQLKKGNKTEIQVKMDELAYKRKTKQPLEFPSAGSTFKRPKGHFAGQLIEESGLKGKGVGGACVSEKHTGFVINKNNGTAQDVLSTIQMVVDVVWEKQKVLLEPEVRIIGEF